MALTATATQGFEIIGRVAEHEVLWLPGDPGITFDEGDLVIVTNGVLVLATDSAASAVGVVTRKTICPASTVPFPKLGLSGDGVWGLDTAAEKTLIPIIPLVAAGTPRYKCTFKNQFDDDVASYVEATRIVTMTTSTGADNDVNGGLLYCYEGPGIGEWNIVEDTTHATPSITLHRQFNTAPTSASKFIYLENAAGAGGATVAFGRVDQADEDELDTSDGSTDGDWTIFCDAREIAAFMKNLTLPVIRSTAIY